MTVPQTQIHEHASVEAPVLTVRDLSVDFHLRTHILHAVRNVSFSLFPGKTLALVGESGSGKSVTTRAILRLLDKQARMTSGVITLHEPAGDTVLSELAERGRRIRQIRGRRIALIFQEPMSSLSPVHTIGSQITEALRLHRRVSSAEARRMAIELLAQVEIKDPDKMVDRYSFEFSGGMRQRAMIAMALACDPDILIADEPTTALDVTTQAEIMDLLRRLQSERKMALLLITHDLGLVAEVADEVAVMRFGCLIERGPVDAIFHDPKSPYTSALLGATLKLEHRHADVRQGEGPAAANVNERPVLRVRNLCKTFGTVNWLGKTTHAIKAVDDATFDLFEGENLGIVGESGSGKSTLGRAVLRVTEPSSGSVTFRNRNGGDIDVGGLSRTGLVAYHRDVRLIFQDPFASLNPRMTVKQVIGEPLITHGLAKGSELTERVGRLLEMVGLDRSALERYPHAFSGGQRQRISIARALALEPRIIIADEATSALDVSIRAQILDLLLELQARLGLSFIFIAHDISVVRYFCDRVLVMHHGRIVEEGDAETICTAPQDPYTQRLISAVPNPDPRHKRMINRQRTNARG